MTTPKVFVIDDDTWMSETYSRVLMKSGMEVHSASNAIAGLDAIDDSRPDVLILDMFMPGPNGVVLLHELQSHEDLQDIPVIISTNAANDLALKDLAPYGVKAIIDKGSMMPDDIVTTVRKVLI